MTTGWLRSINLLNLLSCRSSLLSILLLCLFWFVRLLAQAPEVRNPRTSPADIAAGARLFRAQCSICHNIDGSGAAGPDLTPPGLLQKLSDADLFRIISLGIPGTDMYPLRSSDRRVWQTAAFVRTLSRKLEGAKLPGDPDKGRGLFWGKGQCNQCHMIGGEGGRRGPNLSAIGWQRSAVYLRESLLEASQDVGASEMLVQGFRRYWPVSVTDLQGNVAEGVLLGEDTYSIQLMDDKEQLLSVCQRYSRLDQINRDNVDSLRLKWVFQMKTMQKVETSPLVVGETMFVTAPPSNAFALDARTGRPFWSYQRRMPERTTACCGDVNRGLAILGDRLYLGTLDAYLVALDAKTGHVLWETEVADYRGGYSITAAPLAFKDKIIVGISGGEYGIRGFLDAYDARTGKRVWRFHTIPGPGEPGNDTWEGDSWKTGGGPTWLTGSADPELNLIYWGTGNPSPDWNGEVRKGDNLFTSSVLALDADTGKLRWHFQCTPHDTHDWDAVQIPVLADLEFEGRQRKLMLWANRNAFFYVLDRETGQFLLARAFAKQTWAREIDPQGRPAVIPGTEPSEEGTLVYPGVQGATNWYSPSFSPRTGLFFLSVWELPNIYFRGEAMYEAGTPFYGSLVQGASEVPGWGAVRALVPQTGERKWEYRLHSVPWSGVLSTAGGLVFGGTSEGQFFALADETGEELWVASLGGIIAAGPITYLSQGKQQVAIAAGSGLFVFELP